MTDKNRIDIGDRVNVYFSVSGYELDLEVTGCPGDTGDSWKLIRNDGTVVYVQFFEKMIKINRYIEPPF